MKKDMRLYSGRSVNPLDIRPEDIDIVDIAHALSNICRFNGHIDQFYSVAEHSFHVARRLGLGYGRHTVQTRLAGLLHDASEAYLCDIPRPIKYTDEFKGYREIEAVLQGRIYAKFGLKDIRAFDADAVKHADDSILVNEGIFGTNELYQGLGYPDRDITIEFWTPKIAKNMFLGEYRDLLAQIALQQNLVA